MKKYLVIYLFFILFSFSIFAKDSKNITVGILIKKIQNAKVEDRRELMNQLKLKLREMNKESRKKTLIELKSSFSRKNGENCKGFNKNGNIHLQRRFRHRHFRSHR